MSISRWFSDRVESRPGRGPVGLTKARMRRGMMPSLLTLETKQLLSTLIVTNANDHGAGSFRQAILDADAQATASTIDFAIGTGSATIRPTSALPTISKAVTVDGESQPGYPGKPLITLDGSAAGHGTSGLLITGSNGEVRGLAIDHFSGVGIAIGGNGNTIDGDVIGLAADGTTPAGNGGSGMLLGWGASHNTVGGVTAASRDVISANGWRGVWVDGSTSSGNPIEGNFVGTNAAGTAAIGNGGDGVSLLNSPNNTVGGLATGAGNLISGNYRVGLWVNGGSASGNLIEGNTIGTNFAGTAAMGNGITGVMVDGAPRNTIGGIAQGAGNLISGNMRDGVLIQSAGSTGEAVVGNRIGTNAAGTAALTNTGDGVTLFATSGDLVANNLTSGNGQSGVTLWWSANDLVIGNQIGTDATGLLRVENRNFGVNIEGGSSHDVVGGTTASTRNLISGNRWDGVTIDSSTNNTVEGNYIGVNQAGTAAMLNGGNGVDLDYGSNGNLIGGTVAGAGNVTSGNSRNGVAIQISINNKVQGNFLGTNAAGTAAIPNAMSGFYSNCGSNLVGGVVASARNVISGNAYDGVWLNGNPIGVTTALGTYIKGGSTYGDAVQGNDIGTDVTGTVAIKNGLDGVFLDGATGVTVGGSSTASANVIAGNGAFGVDLAYRANGDVVLGNKIGTNVRGDADLVNAAGGATLTSLSTSDVIENNTLDSNDTGITGVGDLILNNHNRHH